MQLVCQPAHPFDRSLLFTFKYNSKNNKGKKQSHVLVKLKKNKTKKTGVYEGVTGSTNGKYLPYHFLHSGAILSSVLTIPFP